MAKQKTVEEDLKARARNFIEYCQATRKFSDIQFYQDVIQYIDSKCGVIGESKNVQYGNSQLKLFSIDYDERFGSEEEFYDYTQLINRVAEYDIDAAKLLCDMPQIMADSYDGFDYDGRLDCCFLFRQSPQGTKYWSDICKTLGY